MAMTVQTNHRDLPEGYIYARNLQPGMTCREPVTKRQWKIVRPLSDNEMWEVEPGVFEPIMNFRRNKWLVAPIDEPNSKPIFACFDEVMERDKWEWNEPAHANQAPLPN